jgi:hypothetical protein
MSRRRTNREPVEEEIESEGEQTEQGDRPGTFWDQVAGLSEEEWSFHRLYLYRVLPKIDLGSDRNYISRYQRAVDEETILGDHGSGTFYAVLNNTRDRRAEATHTFSLYRLECPPKIDISLVVRCPENESFFGSAWVKGPAPGLQPVANVPTDGAGMERLAKLAVETVKERNDRPSVDPQLVALWQKSAAERDECRHHRHRPTRFSCLIV